ncbi:hypothetical protein O181_008315 [Austropuccinia psidii MF-1]|uniref:Uncharacterized protein n=1 Tax=Austropuccinia psidii MF-1 TaxID=1389203 RepID=A0A9Q3BPP6_9BASI|nr:hypothetical protein [Austropuccinia psidii MF-1]
MPHLTQVPKGSRSGDIPVSVQELVHGRKAAVLGTSTKPLDKDNELISSSKEPLRHRKGRIPSDRLEPNVCQREISRDKSLVEKPKPVIRGSEEAVGPKEEQHSCGSSSILHKHQLKTRNL